MTNPQFICSLADKDLGCFQLFCYDTQCYSKHFFHFPPCARVSFSVVSDEERSGWHTFSFTPSSQSFSRRGAVCSPTTVHAWDRDVIIRRIIRRKEEYKGHNGGCDGKTKYRYLKKIRSISVG